jgi:hypothetical protein
MHTKNESALVVLTTIVAIKLLRALHMATYIAQKFFVSDKCAKAIENPWIIMTHT